MANSLAAELAICRAQLQEALKGHEESQLEVAQLKNKMVTETEQSLHLTKERDRLLSQLLDQGDYLAQLRMAAARVTAKINELHSLHLRLFQEVVALMVQLQTQHTSYVASIYILAEGLKAVFRGQAAVVSALADHQATKEDRWKVREQGLLNQLGSKAATFFQLGFKGATKQFDLQGYPPPRVDLEFLDCLTALSKYLPEAFDL